MFSEYTASSTIASSYTEMLTVKGRLLTANILRGCLEHVWWSGKVKFERTHF